MLIRSGSRVDRIELRTNRGREMVHGGNGGQQHELTDIRVLGFGGRAGSELDQLAVQFIRDYQPSQEEPGLHTAIIGVVPQGERIETFELDRTKELNATRRLFQTTSTANQSSSFGGGALGSAKGEFTAMASKAFGLTQVVEKEFLEQIETEEVNSKTVTRSPGRGFVGLETVQVEVYRVEAPSRDIKDAVWWTFPLGTPEYIEVREEIGIPPLESVIDMTGVLSLQLPVMAARKTERFGCDWYVAEH